MGLKESAENQLIRSWKTIAFPKWPPCARSHGGGWQRVETIASTVRRRWATAATAASAASALAALLVGGGRPPGNCISCRRAPMAAGDGRRRPQLPPLSPGSITVARIVPYIRPTPACCVYTVSTIYILK